MLVIRLKRFGKKKQPFYRIVVANKTAPVKGKYLEAVGFYNPLTEPEKIEIKKDRIKYWLEKGAKTSDTVNNLLVKAGYLPKKQLIKKTVTKKKEKKKKVPTAKGIGIPTESVGEKPAEIPVPKSQTKEQAGGLLEQAEEEIEKEIEEAKIEKTEKAEIAEKMAEEVKPEEEHK